jgi:HlyD family secretion protein
VQSRPPAPLGRGVLYVLLALVAAALAWAAAARLDIVATAEGKLVPAGYLKIVQPAEQGVVREIFVREGERVRQGQVLMRMDTALLAADGRALFAEYHAKRLALRRIDAQLAGAPLAREPGDPPALHAQVRAQHAANVAAYRNALAQERSTLERARHDLAAANEVRAKLLAVLPHYREQEKAFEKLSRDGFAGRLLYTDKQRERIEKEQDLKIQEAAIAAARATIAQSEKRVAQIGADYRRALQAERAETAPQAERLRQELAKQQHRQELLELRAPQSGTVKDLATHTPGTVVAPGTILMTIVPDGEKLRAEVWVSNDDIGFVRAAQPVKIKLAAFPFQKYGVLEGAVAQVSADSTEGTFRALIDPAHQHLDSDGRHHALAAGMQVVAEIHLGSRTVLEYLLSPVRKAFHEAGRER